MSEEGRKEGGREEKGRESRLRRRRERITVDTILLKKQFEDDRPTRTDRPEREIRGA